MTTATLELLACIALGRQSAKRKSTAFSTPTSAGVKLQDLKLVEEFAGDDTGPAETIHFFAVEAVFQF